MKNLSAFAVTAFIALGLRDRMPPARTTPPVRRHPISSPSQPYPCIIGVVFTDDGTPTLALICDGVPVPFTTSH